MRSAALRWSRAAARRLVPAAAPAEPRLSFAAAVAVAARPPAARRAPPAAVPGCVFLQARYAAAAAAPKEIRRRDYSPPAFHIDAVGLDVCLDDGDGAPTVVRAEQEVRRADASGCPLVLNAEAMEVRSVQINGAALGAEQWQHADDLLTIAAAALPAGEDSFRVHTEVEIHPRKNTRLSGLYYSGSMFCTQCEAQGFRRITPSLDRPDAMARLWRCRIEADKKLPVLLSNGNPVRSGETPCGKRHYAEWEDPFPKPSYLFALVAGDLQSISDSFTTMSGRKVQLNAWTEPHNVSKLGHAMASLKQAFKWDEDNFGREYDLDLFNVVAVEDFNMGAMENKGLNVFNTSCLLADPQISTDDDYQRVASVIAHEYFHNWTGNRVTCRDWFQLTLKEGLTVYRDSLFSADMHSAAVKRIDDARIIRSAQFAEDAGPMSHPVRPEQYAAIDNFYTVTVYEKGSEVVRMYATLLGREGFRKGMDLYFERHDGQAVTCDDFRQAMSDANSASRGGRDLTQFEQWYLQKGTPTVKGEHRYDPTAGRFELVLTQSNGDHKLPLHIPFACGLLGRKSGQDLIGTKVLELTEWTQTFTFDGIKEEPVLSPLRDFSAPVKLQFERPDEDLAVVMACDPDPFAAWDAGQELASRSVLALAAEAKAGRALELPVSLRNAFIGTLENSRQEPSLRAYSLLIPALSTLVEQTQGDVDPGALYSAWSFTRRALADAARPKLLELYQEYNKKGSGGAELDMSAEAVGARRLANVLLGYLAAGGSSEAADLCLTQLKGAGCMTDAVGGYSPLCNIDCPQRAAALEHMYAYCKHDALALNKWFAHQSVAHGLDDQVRRVQELMQHPDFTFRNPNRFRSVLSWFAANLRHFHSEDGSGYQLVGDAVKEMDASNQQVAASLARSFAPWRRFEPKRRALMQATLERLAEQKLSKDTAEVVSKCLQA